MLQDTAKLVLLGISTGLAVMSAVPVILCRNRPGHVTGRPEFFLEELYPVGGWINTRLRIGGKRERVRMEKLQELVPFADAQQIARNADEAPAAYAVLLTPLILLVFACTGSFGLLAAGLLTLLFLSLYFDWKLDQTLKQRHRKIRAEYPSMLMDFSVMIRAGLTATAAFSKVARASDGILFQEMQRCAADMENGMSIDAALRLLTVRCPLREINKFVSLFRQNLSKGGTDFPEALDELAEQAWSRRKNAAREQGELAEQKLLLPTIAMFLGILMMVIVPAFRSLLV